MDNRIRESRDVVTIEDWYIVGDESGIGFLSGKVYNHPRFESGKFVTTSRIDTIDLDNRRVVTSSGTTYKLGTPEKGYVEYLKREGYTESLKKLFPN